MDLSKLRSHTDLILQQFSKRMALEEMNLPSQSVEDWLRKSIEDLDAEVWPRLLGEFFKHGPLEPLLEDLQVTEIIINGQRQIWFERFGQWHKLGDEFLSPVTFKNWVHRICAEAGFVLDLNHAFTGGKWRDFRVHMACSPLVHCEFHISLRRQATEPWTLHRLSSAEWANPIEIKILQQLIESQSNILIIGPTGSGKTSVLAACLGAMKDNERAVIIEDCDELPLPNSCSTKMLTRDNLHGHLKSFDLTELVKQSLRMRPQRLVIGEVRGGEAKDLMLALATGHRGSFGTLHADDAKQALLRLEMLVQIGAPQWSAQTIRQLISLSVNHIVVCGIQDGRRHLKGIFKLVALESCGFLLEPVESHLMIMPEHQRKSRAV